jgi:hypothetical protein
MAFADPFAALVDQLSASGRAAYPYLRSQALQVPELSKASILSGLQEAGFSIRRQTGLDIIDLARNKADLNQFFRTYGPNSVIPDVIHTKSLVTLSGGNKVQYQVFTNSQNPLIPEAIFVNSPFPLSENQIYGKAIAAFTYEQGSGMAAEDLPSVFFSIEDARYSPGAELSGQFSDNTSYSGA